MKSNALKTVGALLMVAAAVSAQVPGGIEFENIYDQSKLNFDQPTFVGGVPGDASQLVVVERDGSVFRLVKNGANYDKQDWFSVASDVTTHWDGAWALAFHPKFAQNRQFYILYRLKSDRTKSVIEEWTVDAGSMANPKKARTIIEFKQSNIHASGDIDFGPDGFLYSSQGDRQVTIGTSGPTKGAQDVNELWGKVIRIDVDNKDTGLEYAIPKDNPFYGMAGHRGEIWALGFRMPFRISFDKLTGDLWLGDVGDVQHEEVNWVQKGKNYGATPVEGKCGGGANCSKYTDPLVEFSAAEAGCVIGGVVYREDTSSPFYGVYLVGDYQNKKFYGIKFNEGKTGVTEMKSVIGTMPGRISSIGQDAAGYIYATMYTESGGFPARATHVYRLKHADLKPSSTMLLPRKALAPRTLDLAAGDFRLYGLDGRVKDAKAARRTGADMIILKDRKTGETRKWVPLQ